MESSTQVLCRLLDERGAEYEGGECSLRWRDRYGIMMQAFPLANGELGMGVWSCTPEQAIAVTLGAGTCKVETTENWLPAERYHRCKRCGAFFAVLDASGDIPPRVCPNCGAKVVSE